MNALVRSLATRSTRCHQMVVSRWGGLLLPVAVTILLLIYVNAYVAFVVGFGLMFASAFYLERNIRHLGRVGLNQLATTVRSTGVRDMFGTNAGRDETADPDS